MAAPSQKMTALEFLEWERSQSTRHEFVNGEVFAMAGASRAHVRTVLNLSRELDSALRGRACEALAVDMKLQVEALGRFFYPDLFVTCSARDRKPTDVMSEPSVVFEVLSDSTAAYDRGDKFWAYRQLPTLQEYVLVDPERKRIEVFRREPKSSTWAYEPLETGAVLTLKSLQVQLAWSAVFESVESAPVS